MIENCKELLTVRRVSIGFVFLVIAVHIVLTSALNLWAFPQEIFAPLHRKTNGVLSGTLQGNVCMLVVMYLLLCQFGKLKFSDLGLVWRKLPVAIGAAAFVWLLLNGITWIAKAATGEPTALIGGNVGPTIGKLLGQLFGNALYEETLFRGFLLVQLTLILKKAKRKWGWGKCLVLATLSSQMVFALIHVPNRIYTEVYTSAGTVIADQSMLLIGGIYFSVIWLLSGNLFLAVGLHALVNHPALIFDVTGADWIFAIFLAVIPALIALNRWRQKSKTVVQV